MIKNKVITNFLCVATLLTHQSVVRADDNDQDQKQKCNNCGVVTAIQIRESSGGPGLGAAAGALAGGLLGNQAGKSDAVSNTVGGTAAAIIGAAGGALTGHYAEKAMSDTKEWNVTVRMNNGETNTVTMKSDPNVQTGDQVRVAGGALVRLQEATRTKEKELDDDEKDE
ncbi:outer membrane lipoprotein SlyB [Gammaproteobacteria bacterium]